MNRKLVAFVPRDSLNAVRDAVFGAGAGRIGDYERCSWYTDGTDSSAARARTRPPAGPASSNSSTNT